MHQYEKVKAILLQNPIGLEAAEVAKAAAPTDFMMEMNSVIASRNKKVS